MWIREIPGSNPSQEPPIRAEIFTTFLRASSNIFFKQITIAPFQIHDFPQFVIIFQLQQALYDL
jgi:hypothetical protein